MSGPGNTPNPAEGRASGSTLLSIQVMRGLAAFAVAVYHTHLILMQPAYGQIEVFGLLSSRGYIGVNFFFVLSGFIILYAHEKDIGAPSRAPRYLWRRFSRVYPVYWMVLTVYIAAAYVGIGHPDFSWEPRHMLSSYLLLRIVEAPALPLQLAWTLLYEVTFYLAFMVLILNRKAGIALISAWIVAIVVNGIILGDSQTPWTHAWNIYFLFGGITYFAFRRISARLGPYILGAGIGLLLILLVGGFIDPGLALIQGKPVRLLMLAITFSLVLLGCALSERAKPWRAPAFLMLLGEASYSIYLVHSPAISLLAEINRKVMFGMIPAPLLFLLILSVSVAGGIVAHLILEKPLLKAMRRLEVGKGERKRRREAAEQAA